ncbi:hypothetical protein K474DRAFT_1575568, partial [Panus rudis PR-1116 ss-1]
STAFFEHAFYIGSFMSGILYGVELMMYYKTVRELLKRRQSGQKWISFFVYSTILLLLLTIDVSTNAVWGEIMWIDARVNPGIPTYIVEELSVWYQIVGSTSVVVMALLGDALLLYRLYIIWDCRIVIILFPCLIYIGAVALGILELVSAFKPGGFFFSGNAVNFGIPYYSIIIGMNLIITLLICARLFHLSRQVRSAMGDGNAKLYTSLAAIMVESAAPYTLMGLAFLPSYAIGNNSVVALGQVWAKFTCISPQMIILRIVSGKAWQRET